ncbi:sterol desaturase family protein [Portibacter marinus]|uniref:sterol desaturase family protein n=1 Tax=Portibacter marinus TaxID=2898660 RepID=UPI001F2FE8CF|nr:sterol desaturase family protein [Portibacter marinus]
MDRYIDIFINGYRGYAQYLWQEITHPTWKSYFYWLIIVSLLFFFLEVVIPWRKKQPVFRKDFWLDAFYMFFNFFLFSLIIYNAASDVIVNLFNDGIKALTGFNLQANNPLNNWPMWSILIIGFVVRDFVQWWVHRLLHKSDWLWQFHQVHHSVEEMGFAAHLRFHWMETVVYRTLEYIPLALLGIGLYDFFIIHIFTLAWGHYNHSNISVQGWVTGGILGILLGIVFSQGLLDLEFAKQSTFAGSLLIILGASIISAIILGPVMKYLFNSPEMHIWHHSYNLPEDRQDGINFGLTLAIWDYIFKTARIPHDGKEIRLGFPGIEKFPDNFVDQNMRGISKKKSVQVDESK